MSPAETSSLVLVRELERDPVVLEWREKARTFLGEAERLAVDSEAADTTATNLLGLSAAIVRAAEARRIGLVKPFNEQVRAVNDFFKRELLPFVRGREVLEPKVLRWKREQARRKAEAEAQAERERLRAEALETEAVKAEQAGEPTVAAQLLDQAVTSEGTARSAAVAAATPIRNTIVTPMGASTMQKRWTFKVVNANEIPREFLVLDERAVREAIRLGARDIAGLEIYQDESLAVRG